MSYSQHLVLFNIFFFKMWVKTKTCLQHILYFFVFFCEKMLSPHHANKLHFLRQDPTNVFEDVGDDWLGSQKKLSSTNLGWSEQEELWEGRSKTKKVSTPGKCTGGKNRVKKLQSFFSGYLCTLCFFYTPLYRNPHN